MESAHYIATQELVSLSEQQFIDCATEAHQCVGGVEVDALFYAIAKPVATAGDYPYTGVAGTCVDDQVEGKVKTVRVKTLQSDNTFVIKGAINSQPINLSIQADKLVFQGYKGGILDSDDCGWQPNHPVVAVGFGSENGQEYYLIRNSWGADWGEDGYVRIAIKDGSGVCGSNLYPLYVLTN